MRARRLPPPEQPQRSVPRWFESRQVIWLVWAGSVILALFVLGGSLTSGWAVLGQLPTARDGEQARLVLQLLGVLARGVGMATLLIHQAVIVTSLRTFLLPFTPPPGVTRGWRKGRRRQRQIKGDEPCTEAELPVLRAAARWMLAQRTSPAALAGLLLFALGLALAPLDPSLTDVGAESGLDRAMGVLGAALLLVLSVAAALAPRQLRAAEQFLRRTDPTP